MFLEITENYLFRMDTNRPNSVGRRFSETATRVARAALTSDRSNKCHDFPHVYSKRAGRTPLEDSFLSSDLGLGFRQVRRQIDRKATVVLRSSSETSISS